MAARSKRLTVAASLVVAVIVLGSRPVTLQTRAARRIVSHVPAPTEMVALSPRSTADGHTEASGPSTTSPISTASGWTYAPGSMVGSTSPSA